MSKKTFLGRRSVAAVAAAMSLALVAPVAQVPTVFGQDVAPTRNDKDLYVPQYPNRELQPNKTITVEELTKELPDGTKITEVVIEADEPKNTVPENWSWEKVNDLDFKITSPTDSVEGEKIRVTVTVKYPDESYENEYFTVEVKNDPAPPPVKPTEEPAPTTVEKPTEEPAPTTVEKPTEEPAQPTKEKPTEEPTQPTKEKPTEEPTQPTKEKPTEEPTQPTKEQPTTVQTPTSEETPTPEETLDVYLPGYETDVQLEVEKGLTIEPNNPVPDGRNVTFKIDQEKNQGWDQNVVSVDPESGIVTITADHGVEPGAEIDPIVVTVVDEDAKNDADREKDYEIRVVAPKNEDLGSSLKKPECREAALGWGIPMAVLVPLGLAYILGSPGLKPVQDQVRIVLMRRNTQAQQNLGIFNPKYANVAVQIDAQLAEAGLSWGQIATGLALIMMGLGASVNISKSCN